MLPDQASPPGHCCSPAAISTVPRELLGPLGQNLHFNRRPRCSVHSVLKCTSRLYDCEFLHRHKKVLKSPSPTQQWISEDNILITDTEHQEQREAKGPGTLPPYCSLKPEPQTSGQELKMVHTSQRSKVRDRNVDIDRRHAKKQVQEEIFHDSGTF